MNNSCIWDRTFDENPYATAFNEGRRSVVLDVLGRVRRKWTPTEFADELTQAQMDWPELRMATDPSARP